MSLGFRPPLSMLSSCGFFYADVFFPNFGKPAIGYLPLAKTLALLAKTLALGQPYALGTLLLASVYKAMSK